METNVQIKLPLLFTKLHQMESDKIDAESVDYEFLSKVLKYVSIVDNLNMGEDLYMVKVEAELFKHKVFFIALLSSLKLDNLEASEE